MRTDTSWEPGEKSSIYFSLFFFIIYFYFLLSKYKEKKKRRRRRKGSLPYPNPLAVAQLDIETCSEPYQIPNLPTIDYWQRHHGRAVWPSRAGNHRLLLLMLLLLLPLLLMLLLQSLLIFLLDQLVTNQAISNREHPGSDCLAML